MLVHLSLWLPAANVRNIARLNTCMQHFVRTRHGSSNRTGRGSDIFVSGKEFVGWKIIHRTQVRLDAFKLNKDVQVRTGHLEA